MYILAHNKVSIGLKTCLINSHHVATHLGANAYDDFIDNLTSSDFALATTTINYFCSRIQAIELAEFLDKCCMKRSLRSNHQKNSSVGSS
ncbi:hypothetical protein RB195_018082 [Necator americanus]|uniref:Uncharacterized protein n=1 Tax=Necator americanus TaxID=51031 RepID=A0ABR1CAH8_NECAM